MELDMDDMWLSLSEAAAHLKTSERTVLRRIEARRLAAHKVGRSWRIRRSNLDRLIVDSHTPVTPETPNCENKETRPDSLLDRLHDMEANVSDMQRAIANLEQKLQHLSSGGAYVQQHLPNIEAMTSAQKAPNIKSVGKRPRR